MKILVTGAAGFIGSHIVDALVKDGHTVAGVDNLFNGSASNLNPASVFYEADITDDKLGEVFDKEKPEVVIHHAAQINVNASIREPLEDEKINIRGTLNILEHMKRYGAKKIIYASSAAVYGAPEYLPVDEKHPVKPESFYGISKLTPELYIRTYSDLFNIDFTVLRYSNVYGSRQNAEGEAGVISIFIEKLRNNDNPVIFGDGEQYRDFIYVKDVVRANLCAIARGSREIFNISTNEKTSINQLLSQMQQNLGTKKQAVYLPERNGDIRESCLDNSKAVQQLGWEPVYPLKVGVAELCMEYNTNNSIQED